MFDDQKNMYYLACPEPKCKKKVMEENAGFKCENCNRVYGQCNVTYTFTVKISDLTNNMFVSIVGSELGEQIMGMKAESFKKMKETKNVEEIKEYLNQNCHFNNYTFIVRAKYDTYAPSSMD